jgi:hypothetical protein
VILLVLRRKGRRGGCGAWRRQRRRRRTGNVAFQPWGCGTRNTVRSITGIRLLKSAGRIQIRGAHNVQHRQTAHEPDSVLHCGSESYILEPVVGSECVDWGHPQRGLGPNHLAFMVVS